MQPVARQPARKHVFLAWSKPGTARWPPCLCWPGPVGRAGPGPPLPPAGRHGTTRSKNKGPIKPPLPASYLSLEYKTRNRSLSLQAPAHPTSLKCRRHPLLPADPAPLSRGDRISCSRIPRPSPPAGARPAPPGADARPAPPRRRRSPRPCRQSLLASPARPSPRPRRRRSPARRRPPFGPLLPTGRSTHAPCRRPLLVPTGAAGGRHGGAHGGHRLAA